MQSVDRKNLSTEQQNQKSVNIDNKSISEILHIINEEDRTEIIKNLKDVKDIIFPAPLIITEDFLNKNNK